MISKLFKKDKLKNIEEIKFEPLDLCPGTLVKYEDKLYIILNVFIDKVIEEKYNWYNRTYYLQRFQEDSSPLVINVEDTRILPFEIISMHNMRRSKLWAGQVVTYENKKLLIVEVSNDKDLYGSWVGYEITVVILDHIKNKNFIDPDDCIVVQIKNEDIDKLITIEDEAYNISSKEIYLFNKMERKTISVDIYE